MQNVIDFVCALTLLIKALTGLVGTMFIFVVVTALFLAMCWTIWVLYSDFKEEYIASEKELLESGGENDNLGC